LVEENLFAEKPTEVTKVTHDELTKKEDELFNSKKHNVASLFPDDYKSSLFGEDKPVDNKIEVKESHKDDKSSLFGEDKPVEDSLFGDSSTSVFGSHKKSTIFDEDDADKKLEEAKKKAEDDARKKKLDEEAKRKVDEEEGKKKKLEEEAKKKVADEEARKKKLEEEAKKESSRRRR